MSIQLTKKQFKAIKYLFKKSDIVPVLTRRHMSESCGIKATETLNTYVKKVDDFRTLQLENFQYRKILKTFVNAERLQNGDDSFTLNLSQELIESLFEWILIGKEIQTITNEFYKGQSALLQPSIDEIIERLNALIESIPDDLLEYVTIDDIRTATPIVKPELKAGDISNLQNFFESMASKRRGFNPDTRTVVVKEYPWIKNIVESEKWLTKFEEVRHLFNGIELPEKLRNEVDAILASVDKDEDLQGNEQ